MIRAVLLWLSFLPLWLAGLVIVAVMIPFRKTDESTRKPFSRYPELGDWVFTNFPGWWGNPFDGLAGDKRGDFANRMKGWSHFVSMYVWAAIRNPVNYWSRMVAGIDVSKCKIIKRWGDDEVIEKPGIGGVQYLVALREDGKTFPRLLVVWPWWFDKTHAVLIDIGWKVKLSHNGTASDAPPQDRYKGHVFTLSPWKSI